MKLRFSALSVTIVALIMTVYMFDFGEAQCNIVCTAIYKPVCGWGQFSGVLRTFGNICELNRENKCGTWERWIYIGNGTC
ncbi:vasotab-like [Rhodnius prolixus]|uniref:vasotab-like n=1 Tax=Rhodnius prolixus TaxID=13249 RepID=UPI003D18CEA4